jgi:HrpA-like RNA helicase
MKRQSKTNDKNIGILDPLGENLNPLTGKPYSDVYRNLAKVWSNFPAYKDAEKTLKQIADHSVVLVISGTGSGKTVLFPKFVLHVLGYSGKVAITLPKQIITQSSAEFAAATLDVKVGEEVGYKYRGSGNAYNDKTKLLYCTDGTLVAMLLSDPELKAFDAVLVDEAHERKVNIDFLLYLLKGVVKVRPNFKLIIMSATINEEIFRNYFKGLSYVNLEIGTKTNYPIKSIFMDKDLSIDKNEYIKEGTNIIKSILKDSDDKGGILFFVTSVNETNDTCDTLNVDKSFKDTHICVPVFSGMNEDEQKKATDKEYYRQFVGPNGRKIIITTNVAESSLTIDGISYVIDSGLELKSRYDPIDRIDILEKGFITQAQAKQRMGRTGRTGPGTCYHLYTEKVFNNMEGYPLPSIKVESISYEMLRLLTINGIGDIGTLRETFKKFIEPPDEKYIRAELEYLYGLGMITTTKNDGVLTELGKIASDLQIEPSTVLTMLTSYRLNCFREVIGIVAVLEAIKGSMEQLFIMPSDILEDDSSKDQTKRMMKKFDTAKEHFANSYGDHIAILKIFGEYEKNKDDQEKLREWAYKYFVKRDKLAKAYGIYTKLKQKYRYKISALSLVKPDQDILNTDLKYKVMASFLAGAKTDKVDLNTLKVTKNGIETLDGRAKNIQFDKVCFAENLNEDKTKLFFDKLYRFNNNPIKAKIVSKISKTSENILDGLFGLPLIKTNDKNDSENNNK